MVSLDIWDSSRDPMGDGSTLPDPMNSCIEGKTLKEPLNNTLPHRGWVATACTLFSWPQLANTNTHVHTHKHKPGPLPDFWRDLVVQPVLLLDLGPTEGERERGSMGPKILPQGQPTGNATALFLWLVMFAPQNYNDWKTNGKTKAKYTDIFKG